MIVPIFIDHRNYEKSCYDTGHGIECGSYIDEIEMSPSEVVIERRDLEDIVDKHLDDVIDIILSNRFYKDALLKKLYEMSCNEILQTVKKILDEVKRS